MNHAAAVSMLVTLFAAPVGAQTRCVVRGAVPNLSGVRVAMPSGAPLTLDVEHPEAEATLALTEGAPVAVVVVGALRFEAEAPSVDFALQRSVTAVDSVVQLATAAALEHVRATPSGEAVFDAVIGPSLVVRAVQSPCDALRLGAPDAPSTPDVGQLALNAHPGESRLWTNARPTLSVFARRATGPSAEVSFARRQDSWTNASSIVRLQHVGEWSEVLIPGHGGVVTGWVAQRDLRAHPSTLGGGGSGSSNCRGGRVVSDGPLHAGDYRGLATIDVGTAVFAAPSSARWATVERAEGFRVLYRSGEAWVRLLDVPNVNGQSLSEHAFVPRSAVHFAGTVVSGGP